MYPQPPRQDHTHIVETFMKYKVPLPNGFQALDDVGTPKPRMPAEEKKKTKNLQGDSSILWKLRPHSFSSTSERAVTAKCSLVTTVTQCLARALTFCGAGTGTRVERLSATHLLPRCRARVFFSAISRWRKTSSSATSVLRS